MATKEDMDELIRLATWCRQNGWRLGDVRVGSVEVSMRDIRQPSIEPLREAAKDPTIWEQHGMDENGVPIGDGTVG
jgi:hypothetical protein